MFILSLSLGAAAALLRSAPLKRALRFGHILSTVITVFGVTPLPCVPAHAAGESGAPGATVTIDNFAFTPASLTVKAGTVVTFVNHDDIPHSIVNVGNAFRSRALDTDQSFQFTFATAGDYDYFCGLHPHMKGKIIVAP